MKIELTFSLESAQYLLSLLAKLPIDQAANMWLSISQSVEAQVVAAKAEQDEQAKGAVDTEQKAKTKRKVKAADEAKS